MTSDLVTRLPATGDAVDPPRCEGSATRAACCEGSATAAAPGSRALARAPRRPAASATRLLVALAGCTLISACAPLLVGGAVIGGSLVATDRRTAGIQLEDESIEFKVAARVRELATLGQVNATSYNRVVLLTGEVPGEREKQAVEQAALRVENVRSVVNELAITSNSRLSERGQDALLATKVKATHVDAKDVQANAFKVVVDRATVYLMGRVTEREAARGVELARAVPGVQKVVRVFEILTEDELARLGRPAAQSVPPARSP